MNMNPELPQVRPTVETAPQIPGGVEFFPDGTRSGVESRPAYSPERTAPSQETAPQPAPIAPPIDPSLIAIPQVTQATPTSAVADPVAGSPTIASDDDLIEKEWVDKVKKIISLTKGNPYEQAKSIAALQADYLKKRYSRTVGKANDGR